MKLSCDPRSPDYSPLVRYAEVLFEDKKLNNVIDVDEGAGVATVYAVDSEGKVVLDPSKPNEPGTQQVHGKLTLLFRPQAIFEYGAALNHNRTAHWLLSCGKEAQNLGHLSVQVGVHIEEGLEFLEQLNDLPGEVLAAIERLKVLAGAFKDGSKLAAFKNEEKALDALCDADVTGNGVAYLAGWNKPRADSKVLSANEAKLVNGKPVLLPGGKIGKPEGWSAADLSDCV